MGRRQRIARAWLWPGIDTIGGTMDRNQSTLVCFSREENPIRMFFIRALVSNKERDFNAENERDIAGPDKK